jgi:hypothetical protein
MKIHWPKVNIPDGFNDAESYLRHLVYQGAGERFVYDENDSKRNAGTGKCSLLLPSDLSHLTSIVIHLYLWHWGNMRVSYTDCIPHFIFLFLILLLFQRIFDFLQLDGAKNRVGESAWKNPKVREWWETSGKYWYSTGQGPK